MLKIALTGPESTGKSTLAQQLAKHFQTIYVPEYARTYIEQLDRPYTYSDILTIAQRQAANQEVYAQKANQLLVCDTELLVTKIWCNYVYGKCHSWILEQLERQKFEVYLLLNVDVAWISDPQREHPQSRQELFHLYQRELQQMNAPFVVISGSYEQRFTTAVQLIEELLNNQDSL